MSYTGECGVFSGNTLIGTLSRLAGEGNPTAFYYDSEYTGPALSEGLPKNGQPIHSQGLHPFFSNLISEGWLKAIQERIIEHGEAPTRLEMLAHFGRDCIGALRVVPTTPLPVTTIKHLDELSTQLADSSHALIPGVQPKVLARQNSDGKYYVTGATEASTHIAKLAPEGGELASMLEVEFITTLLVKAFLPNDEVSEVNLTSVFLPKLSQGHSDIELSPALLIKRFDRTENGDGVEMYEFNQLLGKTAEEKYEASYKDMADFINAHAEEDPHKGIRTNAKDVDILFRRILVSILVDNADTHLKNFALLRVNSEFRLTPNYDLVSCARYPKNNTLALAIGAASRKFRISDVKPRDIIQLAVDFGILSSPSTEAEEKYFASIVSDMNEKRELIRDMIKDRATVTLAPIQEIKSHPAFTGAKVRISSSKQITLAEVIIDAIENRWAGAFAGIAKVIKIKKAKIPMHGETDVQMLAAQGFNSIPAKPTLPATATPTAPAAPRLQ